MEHLIKCPAHAEGIGRPLKSRRACRGTGSSTFLALAMSRPDKQHAAGRD